MNGKDPDRHVYLEATIMKTTRVLITTTIMVLALALQACPSKKSRSLECYDPVDGQTISNADDINSSTPGIQIEVACRARGFDIGDPLSLNVQNNIDGNDRDYQRPYDGTGEVLFGPVTVQGGPADDPGNYTLTAFFNDGEVESNPVTIDVVAEPICPSFDWIEPTMSDTVWNLDDDSDLDPSNGFQHDVVITTDAGTDTAISLYLDDALVSSGTVAGTLIRFEDVTFPSGGDTITLRVQTSDTCTSEATLQIDDDAPTCAITAPVPTDPTGWINATFDASATEGMQADITIETEADATVELFIDIPLTSDPTDTTTANTSGGATFSEVSLPEADLGDLSIQVRCTDTSGNEGFSALNTYGVDSILPALSITAPSSGDYFNDENDVNDTATGIQIDVTVDSDQPEDTLITVYDCDAGISTAPDYGVINADIDGSGTGQVDLGGASGPVDICAYVEKASGNSATAGPVDVTVDTEMPQLILTDPDGTSPILNADDEDAGTAGCQYTVTVECDTIGYDVHLFDTVAGERTTTGTCATDGTSSLGGSASFQVTLPEGDRILYAQLTDGAGNVGQSSNVSVTVKSVLPTLSWNLPSSCPWDLYAAGSAYETVRVQSNASPVTLTVYDDGGSVFGTYPDVDVVSVFATFTSVELPTGNSTMQACATDAYGQEGCSTVCSVTVHDIPRIIFTDPTDGALIGIDDDLSGTTAGCQVDVTFTADVTSGSSTELFVDSSSVGTQSYGASSVTYSSVTLPEGASVSIEACATDTRGTGCDEIFVTCDVTSPSTIGTLNSTIVSPDGRRSGTIELSWTAPGDSGAIVAGYEIACSTVDITDTPSFEAATDFSFSGVVTSPGSSQTQVVTGLSIQQTHYCSVRSFDLVGNYSAISPSTSQTLDFLSVSYDGVSGSSSFMGYAVAHLGDVNGDLFDDFIIGSFSNQAFIFFGEDGSAPSSPDVTISSPSGVAFGGQVAGIGNFNGDGYMDVAVADYRANSNKGAVYIYLGSNTWPSVLTDADADLVFKLDDPGSLHDDGAYFGVGLDSAGDINNDGLSDLAVGAPYWNSDNGRAFVLLGRDPMPSFGTIIDVPGDLSTGFRGDLQISSPMPDSKFGYSVSATGLLNNDGYHDLVIGAPGGVSGVVMSGYAYLLYGRSTSSSGLTTISSLNVSITPPFTEENNFAFSVSGIGDYNGDTYNDLAISARYYPDGKSGTDRSGAILVYLNNSGLGPDTTHDILITNDAASGSGDRMGQFLARGWNHYSSTEFDVDQDSIADMLWGTYRYDGTDPKAFVDFGDTLLSSFSVSSCDVILDSITDAGGYWSTVQYAGDINNDGFTDILIGNPYHNSFDGGGILYY